MGLDKGMFIDGLGKSMGGPRHWTKSNRRQTVSTSIGGQAMPGSEQNAAGEGQWDLGLYVISSS